MFTTYHRAINFRSRSNPFFIQVKLIALFVLGDNMRKGQKITEETRRKMSESRKGIQGYYKGKHLSEEHKRKISEANKGKKRPHLIERNKRLVVSLETRRKIGEYRKGKPSCMKGKHHSEETKRKMSDAQTGEKNWNYGKHLSKKTIEKLRVLKSNMTVETKRKIAEAKRGTKNPNWQGGKFCEPYSIEFNKDLKNMIKLRDGFTCRICGISNNDLFEDRLLHVHHIDYDKKNNLITNLITLCNNCHTKTNHKREYWKKLFKKYKRSF